MKNILLDPSKKKKKVEQEIILLYILTEGSVVINAAQEERGIEECQTSRKNVFPIFHGRRTTNQNRTALFNTPPTHPVFATWNQSLEK